MAFGKKRSKTVAIDGKRLGELLEKKGYSPGDACKELGGYTGMMSNAVARGRIAVGFIDLIREKFGINPDEYVTGEYPPREEETATAARKEKPDQLFPPPPRIPLPMTPPPEPETDDACDGLAKAIRGITKNAVQAVPGIDYDQFAVSLFWALDAAIWSITRKYTVGNPVVKEIIKQKYEKE